MKLNKTNILLYILFLNLFFSENIFSQDGGALGIKFGGGVSRYYFLFDTRLHNDTINQSFVPVYNYGLVFSYKVDKIMGMQVEFLYSQKAWEEKFYNSAKRKVLIHSFEVPLLTYARFRLGKKGTSTHGLMVYGGVYGAYYYQSEVTGEGSIHDSLLINYDNGLEYTPYDFGLKAGLGYDLKIGKSNFQLQILYSQGFRNFFESNRVVLARSLNQTLTVSGIYKIPLFGQKEEILKE